MTVKNILLQIKHQNEIYDLYTRTNAQNVIVDKTTGETLKERLATIASKLADDGDVDAKIQSAIDDLVNGAGNPSVLDTIKDLVDWINNHQGEYNDLVSVTSALETSLNNKLTTLETKHDTDKAALEKSISDNKTALESEIATAKNELKTAIDANATAISDLDTKVDTLVPQTGEGALVRRNGVDSWEQLINLVDELPATMEEGQLFAIMVEEDPVATIVKSDGSTVTYATIKDALVGAESGDKVRLTEDVTLTEPITVADGVTIDLNGHTLQEA